MLIVYYALGQKQNAEGNYPNFFRCAGNLTPFNSISYKFLMAEISISPGVN